MINKRIRNTIFLASVLPLFISCTEDTRPCGLTITDLLEKEGNKVFETTISTDSIREFRDKGKDTIKGGYYTFYPNGSIKEYFFLINNDKAIYNEQYDKEGMLMYVNGNPLLSKTADLVGDSLIVKFYLYAHKKEYRVNLILKQDSIITLSVKKDTLYSNVESAEYIFRDMRIEKDISNYVLFEFKDLCTGQIHKFKDSINLHYKPLMAL